jgi:hypothetical protein
MIALLLLLMAGFAEAVWKMTGLYPKPSINCSASEMIVRENLQLLHISAENVGLTLTKIGSTV